MIKHVSMVMTPKLSSSHHNVNPLLCYNQSMQSAQQNPSDVACYFS